VPAGLAGEAGEELAGLVGVVCVDQHRIPLGL
jgi:hypothetical protein